MFPWSWGLFRIISEGSKFPVAEECSSMRSSMCKTIHFPPPTQYCEQKSFRIPKSQLKYLTWISLSFLSNFMTRSSGEQRKDYRFTPTIVHDTFVTVCNFKSIFIVMNTLSVWRVIIQLFFWKHKSRKSFLSKVEDENLIIQNPC